MAHFLQTTDNINRDIVANGFDTTVFIDITTGYIMTIWNNVDLSTTEKLSDINKNTILR